MIRLLAALAFFLSLQAPAAQADCPPGPPEVDGARMDAWMAEAPDRGMLWRLSRDGHDSYLFGSLHVGRVHWLAPGPAVRHALGRTDTLAVEIDLSDPATLGEVQRVTRLPDEPLPAALKQRLEAQRQAACLPDSVAGLHPAMQLATYSLKAAQREGLFADFGQDALMTAVARSMGRPVIALETPASQMAAVLPRGDAELRASIDEGLDMIERGRAVPQLLRLAGDWEGGDLADIENFEQWCDCIRNEDDRAALRRLNDERNGPMALRIAGLHAEGRKMLVVVGALHMTGTHALTKLLQAQGFAVERIQNQQQETKP